MRGTAASTWQSAVDTRDLDALAADLRSAGFCALEVDTEGFSAAQDPSGRLTAAWGNPVARTPDGTFVAWDLRRAGAAGEGDAARRAQLLEPVLVSVGGFEPEEVDGELGQYLGPLGGLSVANPGAPVRVSMAMEVRAVGTSSRELTVSDGDTVLARVTASPDVPTRLSLSVDARRGVTDLVVRVSGPTEKESSGDRVTTAFLTGLTVTAEGDRRAVSLLDQVATGWVLP
ncbi:hypothetical protein G7075_10290 [Phycicoccus sp. HDW14]|uniref:hypothetical protein n=1 Tax=Phycicoccus sp. HDW14 TaxID=2714941 RepID=UPI00140A048B|nr:hypothetical protein [Phycicoccus sp. HDW14]QIM21421.1 hypothetical protein G7075_10290 [Phycicoccus sp. HDW14]